MVTRAPQGVINPITGTVSMGTAMVSTWQGFYDRMHIDDDEVTDRTIFIDTGKVKSTNFRLSPGRTADAVRKWPASRREIPVDVGLRGVPRQAPPAIRAFRDGACGGAVEVASDTLPWPEQSAGTEASRLCRRKDNRPRGALDLPRSTAGSEPNDAARWLRSAIATATGVIMNNSYIDWGRWR
jgi:hypothetical protein